MLNELQVQLAETYEITPPYRVADFLISDPDLAQRLHPGSENELRKETLLVSQSKDQLEISLFIDNSVLKTLSKNNPHKKIHINNINEYWLALEGVSHFLYLTWRASRGVSVTQLELELQAEIDKFLFTHKLLDQQNGPTELNALHTLLFEQTSIVCSDNYGQRERYYTANRYAAKYCLSLREKLVNASRNQSLEKELRRFYRYSQTQKINHIASIQ